MNLIIAVVILLVCLNFFLTGGVITYFAIKCKAANKDAKLNETEIAKQEKAKKHLSNFYAYDGTPQDN